MGLLAAACGGPDVVVFVPESLERVAASDGQTAPGGGFLRAPLAVMVRTGDGAAAPRGQVRWMVTAGTGAVLSDSQTVADGTGRAEVAVRLGTAPGAYTIRAQLKQKPDRFVDFAATAVAPPTVSGVSPTGFRGGDTIAVTGTGFDTTTVVEVAGLPTRVVGARSTTAINAVAPVCLAPGTVSVRARSGAAISNEVSATYTALAEPLRFAVGDYVAVDPSQVAGCVVLPPGAGDTAEYLVAPQGVSGVSGDSVSYRFKGDTAALASSHGAIERRLPFGLAFHDALRQAEAGFARLPRPPFSLGPSLAPTATELAIGDQRSFRVCNMLKCNKPEEFSSVEARVKFVGERAAIYQDDAAPASGFTAADFEALGAVFDKQLYDVATQAFGAESDVDQNGRVLILFTPVVNKLTPKDQCSESFVTGFFFSIDIDQAFANDERSNKGEVFYAIVPDPGQSLTCQFSVSSVRRLTQVTFIHEFQHMISYFQHVLLRGGTGGEELWLNEAMSHLAEELGALRFLSLGDQRNFSDFAIGNLLNAFNYLKDAEAGHVLFKVSPGTLEERGAAWLFLRWVVDQFGDGVIRRLAETRLTGKENVVAATGEPLAQLLTHWFLANYVSDLPGFTAPARLRYSRWKFRTQYADLNSQQPALFDRKFPIVPPVFTGGAFDVSGFLRSGSGAYFRVRVPPGPRGAALELTHSGGAAINPAFARLNIVRVR
ncbi:MAG: hypothetical protein A2W29_10685 [Gemmatimonadetes bacterium RBG_16_66_8]|nr:MAG: hypothetical protein A2W29_10685 [Gemmatimonadetes bacterium RBG_16_66_8]